MRKGGFNMYSTKEKQSVTLYKKYTPKFSKHQDIEVQAYVANVVSDELSKCMQTMVKGMSGMIVQGFIRKGK